MATSQNGYIANDTTRTKVWTVPGTKRTIRLRVGAPGELLIQWAAWFHTNIENIESGVYDDWGYAVRPIRGSTTTLSNHASGTAIDLNATRHPLGVPTSRTFTDAQIRKIRARLRDFDGCIRWGGEWSRPDGMHFEIVASVEKCEATLKKIKTKPKPEPKKDADMPLTDAEKKWLTNMVADECNKAVARHVGDVVKVPKNDPAYDDKNEKVRVSTALNMILAKLESGKASGQ